MYRGLRTDGQGWWKGDLVGDSVIIHGEQEFSVDTIDFGPNVPPYSIGQVAGLKGAIVVPETVGRRTGFCDTSEEKKQIYAGDILRISYTDEDDDEEVAFITTVTKHEKGENLYVEGYFRVGDDEDFVPKAVEQAFSFWEFNEASIKIVGTVYDKLFTFEDCDEKMNINELKEKLIEKFGMCDDGILAILVERQLKMQNII